MFSCCCGTSHSRSLQISVGSIVQKEGVVAEVTIALDGYYLNESTDFLYLTLKKNKKAFDSHLPDNKAQVDPMRV